MYEVFDPRDGIAQVTVPWRWLANLLAWWWGWDYAEVGQGW